MRLCTRIWVLLSPSVPLLHTCSHTHLLTHMHTHIYTVLPYNQRRFFESVVWNTGGIVKLFTFWNHQRMLINLLMLFIFCSQMLRRGALLMWLLLGFYFQISEVLVVLWGVNAETEFKTDFSFCPTVRLWPPLSFAPGLYDVDCPTTQHLTGIRHRHASPFLSVNPDNSECTSVFILVFCLFWFFGCFFDCFFSSSISHAEDHMLFCLFYGASWWKNVVKLPLIFLSCKMIV